MSFLCIPDIMTDDLNKNMFTPNLWFMTDFDQTYIEDNVRILECIKNVDNIDNMSDDERKKMFSSIMETNHGKSVSELDKMLINQKSLEKISKFVSRNYEFEKAKNQLVKCMAYIKLSRDFMHSNIDNKVTKSAITCNHYYKANKYPFHWMSSNSLYSNYYPVVYIAKCLREHCILLAWRVVLICLKKVTETIDFCSNISKLVANADNKICELSNHKRYTMVKKYLFFALVLLKQVIPAQMIQLSGNLKNHANTIGALIMPELNPYVVETYTRITMLLIQQCFFIQCLSQFTTKVISNTSDTTITFKCMLFFLNQRDYEILKHDETEIVDMSQKSIYNECIDVFINMCYENEEVVAMIGAMFQLSYMGLKEMVDRVWKYHLTAPFNDIIKNSDKIDMLPSNDSVFFSEKIKRGFNSEKKGKKDDIMINVYRRTLFATNCKNFMIGTCVYLECLLSCFEISKFDQESDAVIPHIINLANKIELLFLPQYDRKLSAFELMAWLLNSINVRRMLCDKLDVLLQKERSKNELEAGMKFSYVWMFVKRKKAVVEPMGNVKKLMSSVFTTNASNGHKITSMDMKSALSAIERKKKGGSEEDEYDIEDDDSTGQSAASSSVYDNKKINMPFSEDDLMIWSILIGYYPQINNSKKKIFPMIDPHNFCKNPAKVFIPDGFCKEFQEMLLSVNHAVFEKAEFIKGK